MTVAAVFTGATTAAVTFAPEAMAGNVPPLNWGIMKISTAASVYREQLCTWTGGGTWACSPIFNNSHYNHGNSYMFWAGHTWRRGLVKVWQWSRNGTEVLHSCNTNGAYYGSYANSTVTLWNPVGGPLGTQTANEC
jgi:hypothetical protein